MNCTKTLRLRIKDKHANVLSAMAREVNQVWNYLNETSHRAIRERRQWLSGYDLQKLTNGFSQCEGVLVGSATVQQVCEDYAKARQQFKRAKLRWRVSNPKSSKYSLGWIPFKARALRYKGGQVVFVGHTFSLWDSYGLSDYELRAGSFSQDSRGRWYLNVVVLAQAKASTATSSVGIDLGLKEAAVASDAQRIEGRFYRKLDGKLGLAQRARKKQRVKAIHAKIANQRKDMLHKFSTAMVQDYGAIFVGDVASAKLVKTRMAKSTLDAGWSSLKTMLEYKSRQAGIVFEVVNESYTTQTCSCCGSLAASSPKGSAGLRIRAWTCSDCGAVHDRDVNAARNILAAGLRRLAEGIPALKGGKDVNPIIRGYLAARRYSASPCLENRPSESKPLDGQSATPRRLPDCDYERRFALDELLDFWLHRLPIQQDSSHRSEIMTDPVIGLQAQPSYFYRHVDGGYYQVVTIAKHSEDMSPLVVYRHLWPFENSTWARPAGEWNVRFTAVTPLEAVNAQREDRVEAQARVQQAKAARRAAGAKGGVQ